MVSRKRTARSFAFALMSAVALVGVLLQVAPSEANHIGTVSGVFESKDGNLAVDHAAGVDWNALWKDTDDPATDGRSATGDAYNFTPVGDNVGNPDDIYGGGTKQDDACATVNLDGSLGGGNSKFDLSRIYVAHEKLNNVDYLFLGWVRVPQNSQTASSHVAYEFNQGTDGTCGNSDLLKRVPGDSLIVYDFEGGTADPKLKMLKWIASGSCEVGTSSPPCWGNVVDLNNPGVSDGKVNIASVGAVTDTYPNPDQTLGIVEFGEAGINLQAAGVTDPCSFAGHVTGVSRSSGNSGQAQMKDKVGPQVFTLPGCIATTSIQTLVSLSDSATIVGFDSEGAGNHTGDVVFTLYGPEDANCDGLRDSDGTTPAPPRFSQTFSDVTSGSVGPTSPAYQVPADTLTQTNEGNYRWVVNYTGDDKNLPSASSCNSEVVNVNYSFTA